MLGLMPRDYFATDLFDIWDDAFFGRTPSQRVMKQNLMKTDVQKKDGLYVMSIDMPGFDKSEINAELKDGYLTIQAQHSEENSRDEEGYVIRERHAGSVSRSFFVGNAVTEDQIRAAYKDGTLHLSFPDEEEQKQIEPPKQITIE